MGSGMKKTTCGHLVHHAKGLCRVCYGKKKYGSVKEWRKLYLQYKNAPLAYAVKDKDGKIIDISLFDGGRKKEGWTTTPVRLLEEVE